MVAAEATSPDHPAHAYFENRYRTSVANTERAYAEAREDGALRPDTDPATAAQQLIALMDGLQIQWLISDCATDMAGVLRAHIRAQLTVEF